jgi:2-C-methyl-D-erythritol 4-phosphate cytidylyltransferase
MGDPLPKQYLQLAGRTLIEHACAALLGCGAICGLVIALHPDDDMMATLDVAGDERVILVEGGAERADSVLAGLEHLAGRAGPGDWVLVHDAARPCLEQGDVEAMLAQLQQHAVGGLLARPVTDTVKRSAPSGEVTETLPREQLWLAQTPQMFRYGLLREALHRAKADQAAVTDESSALERLGYRPALLIGSPANIKVTYPQDLELAAWYLSKRREA